MNSRIPIKTTFDTVAVALVSAGIGMATTSKADSRMYIGVILIVLGIVAYIVRHTWNEKSKGRKSDEKIKKVSSKR